VADVVQRVREALVGALRDSVPVQGLCGRTGRLVAVMNAFDTLPLPGLTYLVVTSQRGAGNGAPERVLLQLTAWADGDDAARTASALLEAAETALSPLTLYGKGVEVRPVSRTRREAPIFDPQDARRLARADVDLEWFVVQ